MPIKLILIEKYDTKKPILINPDHVVSIEEITYYNSDGKKSSDIVFNVDLLDRSSIIVDHNALKIISKFIIPIEYGDKIYEVMINQK